MEWYCAWECCSVSPHCDAQRKVAPHIFYFTTEANWETSWGGQILILDDRGRFKTHSAPAFHDLDVAAALDPRGNASLLFQRTEHSWHGVRPLQCPPDILRKLFIVTINLPTLQVWWRHASMYPSKRAVEVYGCSVLAGHTYSPQSFSKVSPVEESQKHMAWMTPAACDLNPAYLRNRPSAWVNGFCVIDLLAGGNFNVYPIVVSGVQCSFGGRVYGPHAFVKGG